MQTLNLKLQTKKTKKVWRKKNEKTTPKQKKKKTVRRKKTTPKPKALLSVIRASSLVPLWPSHPPSSPVACEGLESKGPKKDSFKQGDLKKTDLKRHF